MSKNKIVKALRIPRLLKRNGRMTANQLAEELELDARTIKNYIIDLYEAGIEIDSINGRYGGYELRDTTRYIVNSLTSKEFEACLQAEYFLKQNSFVYIQDFTRAIEKLKELKRNPVMQIYMAYGIGKIKYNKEIVIKDQKVVDDISEAIKNEQKIVIIYDSLSSGRKERVIQPYSIFEYQGALYTAAFCEVKNSLRYFKLSRIQSLIVSNKKFDRPEDFNIEKLMSKNIGLFGGETFDLKLRISYPMSYVIKEHIIVDNQEIEELEDKSIIFCGKISGFEDIKRWILSLGSDVKIIEPEELKMSIKKELQIMLKNL